MTFEKQCHSRKNATHGKMPITPRSLAMLSKDTEYTEFLKVKAIFPSFLKVDEEENSEGIKIRLVIVSCTVIGCSVKHFN